MRGAPLGLVVVAAFLSHVCQGQQNQSRSAYISQWCVHGHLIPSIFIIGAQKCATSSLAQDVVFHQRVTMGTLLPGEPSNHGKEKHFFDSPELNALHSKTSPSLFSPPPLHPTVEQYVHHFPSCSSEHGTVDGGDDVSLDATPRYVRNWHAPRLLWEVYGGREQLATKVTLVVTLRDPVDRIWSWFRFVAKAAREAKGWGLSETQGFEVPLHGQEAAGFGQWVDKEINNTNACRAKGVKDEDIWPKCGVDSGLVGSLYGPQLKHWLQIFDPSQFVLVSFDCYVQKGPRKILEALEARGVEFRPGDATRSQDLAVHANDNSVSHNSHPVDAMNKLADYLGHLDLDSLDRVVAANPGITSVNCGIQDLLHGESSR